jgi:hypothetical protein
VQFGQILVLMSAGYARGWTLLPAPVAVFALSISVFTTVAKGWPAAS